VQDQNLQPFAAALVNMAGMELSKPQYVLQLPPSSRISGEHQQDALHAAINLFNTPEDMNRVVAVNAMESLREALTQCAVCPGEVVSPCPFSPGGGRNHDLLCHNAAMP
jgi:hypothetical protein